MDSSDLFEKYLNKALKFLSFRPRSEKEVRDNLFKKKAPSDITERIIKSLKDQKFLDDTEFAKWFVEQRLRFRPKSLRIIELELRAKGIGKEIIDELGIRNKESGEEVQTDFESAKKLVVKKLPKYKGPERQVIYQKLGAFLARRGFDWDTIKKAIDECLEHGV